MLFPLTSGQAQRKQLLFRFSPMWWPYSKKNSKSHSSSVTLLTDSKIYRVSRASVLAQAPMIVLEHVHVQTILWFSTKTYSNASAKMELKKAESHLSCLGMQNQVLVNALIDS